MNISGKTIVLGLTLVVAWRISPAHAQGEPKDAALFKTTCSKCHAAKTSWRGDRTLAEWNTVVKRMKRHAEGGPNEFNDAVATRIAAYLGKAPSPSPPAAADADAPVETKVPPKAEHHDSTRAPRDAGTGGIDLHELGGALGGGTVVILVALIASGLARRRLKRRFRPIHKGLAVAFGVLLAGHAVILLLQTGTPRSLWHGCGVLALTAAAAGAAVGLTRRRFKRRFLTIHRTLAFTAFVLVVLHRVLE